MARSPITYGLTYLLKVPALLFEELCVSGETVMNQVILIGFVMLLFLAGATTTKFPPRQSWHF